jgi:hypothetical protein
MLTGDLEVIVMVWSNLVLAAVIAISIAVLTTHSGGDE